MKCPTHGPASSGCFLSVPPSGDCGPRVSSGNADPQVWPQLTTGCPPGHPPKDVAREKKQGEGKETNKKVEREWAKASNLLLLLFWGFIFPISIWKQPHGSDSTLTLPLPMGPTAPPCPPPRPAAVPPWLVIYLNTAGSQAAVAENTAGITPWHSCTCRSYWGFETD